MRHERLLLKGAEELGIVLTLDQVKAFSLYLGELKKWNRVYNLTALKGDEDIIVKHFLDSLSYLKTVPLKEGLSIIDIGTGAGFPGIPIRISRPDLSLTLCDSSLKKTLFLRHICRTLRLKDVKIIERRIEALTKDLVPSFDILVTRALYKLRFLIRLGIPLLKRGGLMIVSKGPEIEKEIKDAEEEMTRMDVTLKGIVSLTIPILSLERKLIVIGKDLC